MTSTFSTNKNLEEPANGDYVNSWQAPVNNNFNAIDTALGGVAYINAVGAIGTNILSIAQYRPPIAYISGAITANLNYQIPSGIGGFWYVINNTTGAYTVTLSSGGGGTSFILPQGYTTAAICDGQSVMAANTTPSAAAGANAQVQFNSNGLFGGSSSLTWNGSVLSAPTFNGAHTGNVTGNVTGSLTGNVTGNVTGSLTGNVTGNVTGNLTGNVTGNVSGSAGTASTANYAASAGSATSATSASTSVTQASTDSSTNIATTAFTGLLSLGVGQSWQNMSASRVLGGTYTNTSTKPICFTFTISYSSSGNTISVSIGGVVLVPPANANMGGAVVNAWPVFTVPAGATYSVVSPTGGVSIGSWTELR